MVNSGEQRKKNKRGRDKNGRTMHPNSLKNLANGHPNWEPGESGNPQGQSLKAILNQELLVVPTLEEDGYDGKGRTNARLMIRKEVRDARMGDRYARAEVWERHEGKVTQTFGGDPEKPVYIINVPSEQGKCDIERVLDGERT